MSDKDLAIGLLLVVVIMLVLMNSDVCQSWLKPKCGCGKTPCACASANASSDALTAKASTVKEAFSKRPYHYNQDTIGKGVAWQSDQLNPDRVMSHDDYMRSVGIDKATVENHREWYEDPNIKPYYGSNFNLRSDIEQATLVPTVGLRRRPTAVPLGVSARQVPDLDEREYAESNQLRIGNFA